MIFGRRIASSEPRPAATTSMSTVTARLTRGAAGRLPLGFRARDAGNLPERGAGNGVEGLVPAHTPCAGDRYGTVASLSDSAPAAPAVVGARFNLEGRSAPNSGIGS